MSSAIKTTQSVKYSLDPDGRFNIENYNQSKTFSNFFPGIAGVSGVPMWVFYVNRGQCVASFGIESKNKAILEFQPANKSYRLTSLQGFRTFIKVKSKGKEIFWEPFQSGILGGSFKKSQNLSIAAHDLILEEINQSLQLKVTVQYFTLPEEPFAALVRQVKVENLGSKSVEIEIIDGLPVIIPYGLKDDLNKNISRTIEAWVKVRNLKNRVPFYQLNVEVSDKPQVVHIDQGNFFLSFDAENPKKEFLQPIVETACIFGEEQDFVTPQRFLEKDFEVPVLQQMSNRSPSAMSYCKFDLRARANRTITSLFGYAANIDALNVMVKKVKQNDFIESKRKRNKEITDGLRQYALTQSSSEEFNQYSSYTFLDNILRGGIPTSIKTGQKSVTFNVFSRKHGDLERDYNYFVLAPTFYSQGNGNYRDVNQNRRNDVWFNKNVEDSHIMSFLNLIQPDGYNPLIVKGASFTVKDEREIKAVISKVYDGDKVSAIVDHVKNHFLPGDLLSFIDKEKIKLKVSPDVFLGQILEHCHRQESAEHGEGFWSDHWSYNLDLVESFLSFYPENLKSILLENKNFTFYINSHYVMPQNRRYVLTDHGVRQYHSVYHDKELHSYLLGHQLRINNGKGAVYHTNLLSKLLCLVANKVATLDPEGIGVEMEADKPNWDDSLNGLPGLLGSSLCETIEIKRLSEFVLSSLDLLGLSDQSHALIFEELSAFILSLSELLGQDVDPYSYWLKSNGLKERYREKVRRGINGAEKELSILQVKGFLKAVIAKIDRSMDLARTSDGFLSSYFYYEVLEFEKLKEGSQTFVQPLKFKRHSLPLFLEGYVHAMRVVDDIKDAKKIYKQVVASPLFDTKLKMFKLNADLSKESEEIGRLRIFPRGWLENESIWLHMEYKFLLEVLKNELYEDFYESFKNILIAFQDPARYGRNILENSSFIVSSVHEDKDLHGRGFVARLSGSTAEFIHMWLLMNVGKDPFKIDVKNHLTLTFNPALAGWLFTKEKSTVDLFNSHSQKWQKVQLPANVYAFKFLGSTLVVYHNPKRRDTFGDKKASVVKIDLIYPRRKEPVRLAQSFIPSAYANDVRQGLLERIDVYLE